MKSYINAIIMGLVVLISVMIVTVGYTSVKKGNSDGISVTGSAKRDFVSDLIVWRGSFSRNAMASKDAYADLKTDAEKIKTYLLENGVEESEIVFSSIDITENYEGYYDEYNNYISTFAGYKLTQRVTIESGEVDKIEAISRDITDLIDLGINFLSWQPEYYYTKLDELKIEMIAEATKNARLRAEIVAENANSSLGNLKDASLGVFQITAQNSSEEEYSYGGAFNTSSKNKTATITTKLFYYVK